MEIFSLGKRFIALFRDPLLVVWEAMNLLSEVDACPDAPRIKTLITDAEAVLSRLTMELARRQKLQNQYESQGSKIVPIHRGAIAAFAHEN